MLSQLLHPSPAPGYPAAGDLNRAKRSPFQPAAAPIMSAAAAPFSLFHPAEPVELPPNRDVPRDRWENSSRSIRERPTASPVGSTVFSSSSRLDANVVAWCHEVARNHGIHPYKSVLCYNVPPQLGPFDARYIVESLIATLGYARTPFRVEMKPEDSFSSVAAFLVEFPVEACAASFLNVQGTLIRGFSLHVAALSSVLYSSANPFSSDASLPQLVTNEYTPGAPYHPLGPLPMPPPVSAPTFATGFSPAWDPSPSKIEASHTFPPHYTRNGHQLS
jgi:hypothetical protein